MHLSSGERLAARCRTAAGGRWESPNKANKRREHVQETGESKREIKRQNYA